MPGGYLIRKIPEVSGHSRLLGLDGASNETGAATAMTDVFDLWDMAHEAYARARSMPDDAEKQETLRLADSYLRQAEQIRRAHTMEAGLSAC
jgi:hypothetical protein